jgi:hypothetical protein
MVDGGSKLAWPAGHRLAAPDATTGAQQQPGDRALARARRGVWPVPWPTMAGRWPYWAVAFLWLFHLGTYQPYVDGSARAYAGAAVLAGLTAISVGILAWLERPRAASVTIAFVVAWLPLAAPHLARLTFSVFGPKETRVQADFQRMGAQPWPPGGAQWEFRTSGHAPTTGSAGGDVSFSAEGLALAATPGYGVWAEWQVPLVPEPARAPFWLPIRYAEAAIECLDWEAQADVQRSYLIVADLGFTTRQGTLTLLLQATPSAVQLLSQGPHGVAGLAIPVQVAGDGLFHHWHVQARGSELELSIDGQTRWMTPDAGRLRYIRFGETRTDDLHGGRVVLRRVDYYRRHGVAPLSRCASLLPIGK